MALSEKDYSQDIGSDWVSLAAGTYNLADGSCAAGVPLRAARRIYAAAAGTWSMLKNANGVDRPLGAVALGYTHDAHTQQITTDAAIRVYW